MPAWCKIRSFSVTGTARTVQTRRSQPKAVHAGLCESCASDLATWLSFTCGIAYASTNGSRDPGRRRSTRERAQARAGCEFFPLEVRQLKLAHLSQQSRRASQREWRGRPRVVHASNVDVPLAARLLRQCSCQNCGLCRSVVFATLPPFPTHSVMGQIR
jgi:hypothetical protein